ncbi:MULTISPECIES: ABC transporter permease [unclassified Beijerinckia]|uniref:ABC transporter permease n=1 Tax=unclassified Beijerinckia TaxID=2638183 RepID=UPI000894B7A8|nr:MULTISPECIES: ABC transporter permease [unclassified Beijerinckia]MDH7799253.1 putative spermidine/putrescine transport system permease protein [Beijerinckia sp. GAS462]SED90631.1 putative spermidine/putrescine transport system permease protein [Beijerinckia sp. 28-YEA-48]
MTSLTSARRRKTTLMAAVLVLPALIVIAGLMAVPLAQLVQASFHRAEFGQILPGRTFENYQTVLFSPLYWEIYAKTLGAAALVTLLCTILGYPVAWHLVNARKSVQPLLFFLIAAPLLVNTVVRTYGWLLLLGRKGVINTVLMQLGLIDNPLTLTSNYIGLVVGSTQVFLPFMILSIATSLQGIDRRLLESADILGASGPYRFFTVDLPLAAPGLIAGAILVFSLMLGAFVTPLMLGGSAIQYLSVSVYTDALVLFNLPRATALSMILLAITAAIYAFQARLSPRLKETQR